MTTRWLILMAAIATIALTMPVRAAADERLDSLVAEALARSEELGALRARLSAAEAMVRPAGALPDPMASVGLSNIPVGSGVQLDQDMMSSVMLMVSQEVPPAGRRTLLRGAQEDEAAMLRAQLLDAQNDLVRKVKKAYLDVQYSDEALEVAERNRALAQDMLTTAEALYATGKVMQQDVFQAQVRLSQMLDMVVMQRREREAAVTRLNRLLYREPSTPLEQLSPLARGPAVQDAEMLRTGVREANPGLWAMRFRAEQAEKERGVARSGIDPNFTFSFAYMIRQRLEMNPDSGDDMWSATIGVNLPWLYRREKVDQEVKAAGAHSEAAARDVEAMSNELGAMVEELTVDIRRADEQLALLETGLLPQAEGAFAASRATYATGRSDLLDLLDNQMNLYNLQLQRAHLLADRGRAMADLAYVTGGRWGATEEPLATVAEGGVSNAAAPEASPTSERGGKQ